MIQTKENIGKLLERFVQGLTTESEEQLLSDYFCTAEAIPEEWMVYKELFDSFSTDVYDFSEDEKDAMLARVPRKKAKSVTLWIWAVAACVVAVMVIAIPMMRNSGEMAQKPVAEVRRQVEVKRVVETPRDEATQMVEPRAEEGPKNAKSAGRAQEKQTERISTPELLEAVALLADVVPDDIVISSQDDEFKVSTVSVNGSSNSYMLRRGSGESSIELISQSINF
uniref:hypothetical protein n=1 Tax=Prevotella sp. TaxID=59823 RepID=UPI004029734D